MPSGKFIRTPETRKRMSEGNIGVSRNKGIPKSVSHKEKMSIAAIGKHNHEKNAAWKGEGASYIGIHQWVYRWKGKPSKCENCGTETATRYEWANIDHKYRRVLEDYIRLCKRCHVEYDKLNN